MGENSAIEWTHHTFNPWWGCSKVGPGCANCYAEKIAGRLRPAAEWRSGGRRVANSEMYWLEPLKWQGRCAARGIRERVFCGSMCDVFEDGVDVGDLREEVFRLVGQTPNLDWLLLTKRPQNALRDRPFLSSWPSNAWLGASASTQGDLERMVPPLLDTPVAVRFLSLEPLLGPINLQSAYPYALSPMQPIDWVIVGAESGPRRRPCHREWVLDIRDQCAEAGVPLFVKQIHDVAGRVVKMPTIDGVLWDQMPDV